MQTQNQLEETFQVKTFIIKHKRITALSVALFWLLIWQILSLKIGQILLLPSPILVLSTLWGLVKTALFWKSVAVSLIRILLGVSLGILLGCIFAFCTEKFILLNRLFSPLLYIVRTVPVASFIILALVWIHVDFIPIFISFLMVFPLVWENIRTGIRAIDPSLIEMADIFRLSHSSCFFKIKLPSLFPYLISSSVTSLGFGWKAGIAAEVICRPLFSIGRQLQDAKTYLDTPEVFAWTLTVVILSVLLEKALKAFLHCYQNSFHLKDVKSENS